MKCVDVRNNLSAFVDGETGVQIHREIKAHLESCRECAAEAEGLMLISGHVKSLPIVVAPKSVDAAVFAALLSQNYKDDSAPPVIAWHTIPRIAWICFALITIVVGTSAFFVGANIGFGATQPPTTIVSVPSASQPTPIEPEIRMVTEFVKQPCAERFRRLSGFTAANKKTPQDGPVILLTDADLSGMKPLAKLEVAVIKE